MTLTWGDGPLTLANQGLMLAIDSRSFLEGPIGVPSSVGASSPNLSWHGQLLDSLRRHAMARYPGAEDDPVDPGLLEAPDIRHGPIGHRRIFVNGRADSPLPVCNESVLGYPGAWLTMSHGAGVGSAKIPAAVVPMRRRRRIN